LTIRTTLRSAPVGLKERRGGAESPNLPVVDRKGGGKGSKTASEVQEFSSKFWEGERGEKSSREGKGSWALDRPCGGERGSGGEEGFMGPLLIPGEGREARLRTKVQLKGEGGGGGEGAGEGWKKTLD